MTSEQQALAEMPIWLVILLAVVGGVSGEMWRADKEGARGWSLLRRLALRSGACMICGVSAIMLGAGLCGAIVQPIVITQALGHLGPNGFFVIVLGLTSALLLAALLAAPRYLRR